MSRRSRTFGAPAASTSPAIGMSIISLPARVDTAGARRQARVKTRRKPDKSLPSGGSDQGGLMYLGIDVGTSSVKAVLIDADQNVVGSASEPLTVQRPHPGWSEQNPEDWVEASSAVIDALAKKHPQAVAGLRGIGLSGQQHGATLIDHAERPLRPAILWNDGRAGDEAAELNADPRFREITGNFVFAGFTAPKLVWVRRHEPKCFGDICKVLLPKDYVRLWLSGESASDMSDSAGTAWLNVAERDWSDELLAATHLDRDRMPRLYEGTEPTGKLRQLLATRWGMAAPPVIAGGGGDN